MAAIWNLRSKYYFWWPLSSSVWNYRFFLFSESAILFSCKPVTKLVFRDFFKYQRTLFYMYFPDQSKSCPIKLEFASTKGRWEYSQENWESLLKAIQWDSVFWVLGLTFSMEICQAPIKDQSWTKNHLLTMNQLSQPGETGQDLSRKTAKFKHLKYSVNPQLFRGNLWCFHFK